MGFLDRAKKLAEQAKDKAEGALAEQRARREEQAGAAGTGGGTGTAWGTPYVPGMLGRPGWREQGLDDPAAVLPVAARHAVGIDRSTRSAVVEEPFGMGRRWSSGGRSAGLFHRVHPDHQAWEPAGGTYPLPGAPGAAAAELPDGRTLVFLDAGGAPVVLETGGLEPGERDALVAAVVS
jgi:hypothetical protein